MTSISSPSTGGQPGAGITSGPEFSGSPGIQRKELLAFLFFGHFVIHWFQQMLPMFVPMLKADLGLSDIQVGGMTTAKQAASGVLTLPSGILADSFVKHRPVLLGLAIILGGVAYFLVSLSPIYMLVLLSLFLVGASSAFWHPSSVSSLSTFFPRHRGTALAIHGVGASVGDSISPLCIGGLLLLMNWQTLAQWHILPAAILGLMVWASTRRFFAGEADRLDFSAYKTGLLDLARHPSVFAVMGASSLVGMARLSTVTFLPLYLVEDQGYSSVGLGFHWMLLYVMGTISQPVMGIISDKFSRKMVLLPSFAIMGILYFILPSADKGIELALVIAAMGAFFYGTGNIATAAVLDVASRQIQGTTNSIMSLFQQTITLPAPIIAGYIATEFGLTAVFYFCASLLSLATLAWVFIKLTPRDVGEASAQTSA